MIESTVDVKISLRIPVKTDKDPGDYTIKEWKMLLAKRARQAMRNATLEDLSKDIRSNAIVYRSN